MQYYLVRNIAEKSGESNSLKLFLDYKDAWSGNRSNILAEYLNKTKRLNNKIFTAQPLRSHEVIDLQLADLITGVKSRIIAGTCLTEPVRSEEYYVAATKVRTLIAQEFAKAFGAADFILQPVTPALSSGISTAISESVSEIMVKPICSLPLSAACIGDSPRST